MNNRHAKYQAVLEKFIAWAGETEQIRAAFIVGSRARSHFPADEWSDLDLVILTTSPEDVLLSTEWLEHIGPWWITFLENTPLGGTRERRVLFEDGVDVDFAVFPVSEITGILRNPEIRTVLGRGMKVVLDKDDLFANFSLPPESTVKSDSQPNESDFLNLVNDFWYHAVLCLKKWMRGEYWDAKMMVDGYMKWKLLRMLEWHAKVKKGPEYDTWHQGRFFDTWADPRVKTELEHCFAHYSKGDIKRALFNTMDLFQWVSAETAEGLKYEIPVESVQKTVDWIRRISLSQWGNQSETRPDSES